MAHFHGPPLAQPPVLAAVAECRAPGCVGVDSKSTASRQRQREHQHHQHLRQRSQQAKCTGALLSTSLALLHSRRRCFQDRSRKRRPFRTCVAAAQYGDEFVGDAVDTELADSLRQRTLESLDLDFVLEKLQVLCYTQMAAEMAIDPEALMANSAEEARALYATGAGADTARGRGPGLGGEVGYFGRGGAVHSRSGSSPLLRGLVSCRLRLDMPTLFGLTLPV